MRCPACKKCRPHPKIENECLYNGPFEFVDLNIEHNRLWYDDFAERMIAATYWSSVPEKEQEQNLSHKEEQLRSDQS